jgi:hypothetical protein
MGKVAMARTKRKAERVVNQIAKHFPKAKVSIQKTSMNGYTFNTVFVTGVSAKVQREIGNFCWEKLGISSAGETYKYKNEKYFFHHDASVPEE